MSKSFVLAAVVLAAVLSGCATVKTTVSRPIPFKEPVTVISDRELDDWKIHNLIVSQLQSRGYQVRDGGDAKTNPATTVFRYNDRWSWDIIMFLRNLDVRLVDGKTGDIYASGGYAAGLFHLLPASSSATQDIFENLEAKGAFKR